MKSQKQISPQRHRDTEKGKIFPGFSSVSLVELLVIRLSPQAGKSLVMCLCGG